MNSSLQVSKRFMKFRNAIGSSLHARCYSSGQKTIVKHDSSNGVSVMYMNNPPVNGLNIEMLKACTNTIKSLESEKDVKAVVVTSNFNGKVFSGGLDILDMFQKSNDHLEEFWTHVQDWFMAWYGCKKPTVAAINGQSPAGGCALAMACDYRVMQSDGNATIGLNETKLGLAAPFFFIDIMIKTIGPKETHEALLKGGLYSAEDALQMGLVHKIVPLEEVLSTSIKEALSFTKVPLHAFAATKLSLRESLLNKLLETRKQDVELFVRSVSNPVVQKNMGIYLSQLKARKK